MKHIEPFDTYSNNLSLLNNAISKYNDKIEGKFLNKEEAIALQKEIEDNYIDDISQHFNRSKHDIRMNMFNYDNPIAQKTINGVDLRIGQGLTRDKRPTYLLYANGKIIGEFYSVQQIKDIINHIEKFLIKKI